MMQDKHLNQKIFHEAQQFHRLGAFEQALKLYKNLYEMLPKEVLVINLIAQVYIQINQLEDAIEWLTKSLKLNQSQPEAHLNLGSIFFQTEDWSASLENFNKVIDLDKRNVIAYFNRGLVFKKLLRLDEALDDLNYALSLDKNNFEILNEIATTQSELFRYEDALKNYDTAIKLNTNFPPLFFNKSLTLDLLNRHEDALSDLDKAIQLDPRYLDAINFRAIILGKLNRYDEALKNLDHAIQINPNFVEAYFNKASILKKFKRFNEAVINYEKAIEINPQYVEAFNNLGTTYSEMKRYEEAVINYDKAIEINPQYAEPYRNKAVILNYLKHFEGAISLYDKAIELDPNMHEAYLNKSIIQLKFCNFDMGWKNYEYRWGTPKLKKENISQTYLLKNINELGRIFLCEEQGIGDKILYASLLHELDNKNYDIFLETDERLLPIFKRSFNHIKIVSKKNRPDLSLFDSGFGIGSLPGFLRRNLEAFKSQKVRFLESNQEKKINFRKILKNKSSKQICGLAWKSGNQELGANKSIGLENFAKLSSLPNTTFVNLQYQASDDEIQFLKDKCKIDIINLKDVDIFNDIDSLFSLVDACDFIVTSSNVTAHISGSLGKKSYLLIPNDKGKLWYWHEHVRSIWYPSVQIFNQLHDGNWQKPITDVYEKILKEVSFG